MTLRQQVQKIISDNEFLCTYSKYIEHTEAPLLMHIWSAIGITAAAMGRHVHYPFALGDIYANQYIILVGNPATRKSSAIKLASKLLENVTDVVYAPDDTGGERQGLLMAMANEHPHKNKEAELIMEGLDSGAFGMEGVQTEKGLMSVANKQLDKHSRFAQALEFGSFVGERNTKMTRFLIRVWDGDPYDYTLKKETHWLKNSLLNIVGASTTEDIAKCIPIEASGQGFLSRIIFVHAANKEKDLTPRETKLCSVAATKLQTTLAWINHTMSGAIIPTAAAEDFVDEIYRNKVVFADSRFTYYIERRFTHVIKLAMTLAAMRRSLILERKDFVLADNLLRLTEIHMPDALGEYGMSKLGAAKQQLLEFLIAQGCAVSMTVVGQILSRDLDPRSVNLAIQELQASNKIICTDMQGGVFLTAVQESTAHALQYAAN